MQKTDWTRKQAIDLTGMTSQSEIGRALNISQPRVSQLVGEIKEELGISSVLPSATATETEINDLQDSLELKILKAFEEKLPMFTQFAKPLELIKCGAIVNAMKRRTGALAGAGAGAQNITINDSRVVHLDLRPAAAQPELILDERTGSIIEAGGRTLVTASKMQILDQVIAPGMEFQINELRLREAAAQTQGNYLLED